MGTAIYNSKMMKNYSLKLHRENDQDIIKMLDTSENKQKLIKDALRAYKSKEGN